MKSKFIASVLCFGFLLFGAAAAAHSATLTVTKIADTNDNVCDADCSLREAIFAAASGDTVEFASPLFDTAQTIELTPAFGALVPERNITISGKGANLTSISGSAQIRVFVLVGNVSLVGLRITGGRQIGTGSKYGAGIFNSGNSTITNCIISGNLVAGTNESLGGGIYNESAGRLTIVGSTISGNVATFTTPGTGGAGGGIANAAGGILSIVNSTVSGNDSHRSGGGILSIGGTLNITNSTITQNISSGQLPAGVEKGAGTLRIVNTIISGNSANNNPGSIHNVFLPAIDLNLQNFIDGNAQLGSLGDNGGTTQTHAPSLTSPAVNAGNNCVQTANSCGYEHPALTTDQRGAGFPRNVGASVDIGAFEYKPLVITPETLRIASPNVAYSQQITAAEGIAPYSFALDSGTLPNGITLSAGGLLSGTTTQIGAFNLAVRATDVNGVFAVKNYVLTVDYYVVNANSSGAGSLRQLIQETPAGGTIRFDPTFFNVPRTIEMDGANLVVNKNLTINGPGANLLTLDGENATHLFSISNVTLNLSGMRLTRGFAFNGGAVILSGGILNATGVLIDGSRAVNKGGGIALFGGTLNLSSSVIMGNSSGVEGGGIRLEPGSSATITNSTVSNNSTDTETGGAIAGYSAQFEMTGSTMSGNRAPNGGAVFMGGSSGGAVINSSTVSGNTATTGRGGAVLIVDATYLNTTNTTITNNKNKSNQTGGIFVESPAAYNTRNTIIAGNCNQNDELDCRSTSTSGNPDVSGVITGFGYNLLGNTTGNSYAGNTTGNLVGAANLAPLGNYGGATQTHALLPNSQAINAGDPNNSFTTDQRGSTRPIGGRADIGSFERNIVFDQTTLPNAVQNSAYNQTLTITRLTSLIDENQSSPDNLAPFTFSILSIAGQSLPNGLTMSSAGVISGTPTTVGSFTFTVRATDTDGIVGASQFTIAVANTPPTITASGISRVQSSPVSNSTIAAVNDIQSGANGVIVTVTSANPSNGVTLSTIVNTDGTITANAVAACGATNANFTLTATDGGGATATATLTVTVTANTAPTLVYPALFNVSSGGALNISPTTATDNGTVSYSIFSVSPVLTTAPTVNSSGVVSITNASPLGNHTITVRATDACNLTTNAGFTLTVEPPVRIVTKTADTNDGVCDGDCSLREAIAIAVSGDTILFATPLFNSAQTITLASELSVSGKTITILGKGANLTAISGNNITRVFNVGGGGNLTLDSLTVTNGRDFTAGGGIYNGATLTVINSTVSNSSVSGGSDNFGGGIYNASQATLTIRNSTISGNSVSGSGNFSNRGGGIANVNGSLTITNSTVSGNSLGGGTNNRGGGIYSEYGPLTIINDTITNNVIGSGSFNYGGGLAIVPDGANIVNTIISGNSSSQNPDVIGGVNYTTNFIGGDARLAPLGFYGGATQTHALLSDSPVINAGNNCILTSNSCANGNPSLATDQRGSQRLIGETVDIGAFESNITFDQTTIPNGDTSLSYSQQLSASRQTSFVQNEFVTETQNLAPTNFEIITVAGQSLPPGITLSIGGLLSGMPTMTGTYTFTVKATDTDGIAGVRQYTMQVFAPTAANVSISGRVLTADSRGLRNAFVTLTDASGNSRLVRTTAFGYYYFEDVSAGQTYTFSVRSKHFQFAPRVVNVTEDLSDFDFTALE